MSYLIEVFITVGDIPLKSEWVSVGGESGGVAVQSLAAAHPHHPAPLVLIGALFGSPLGQVLICQVTIDCNQLGVVPT